MCSAETAAKLEESRRRDVFENSPDPSQEKDVNMANALKWHSGGWNKGDCYLKAGAGKKLSDHLILSSYVCSNLVANIVTNIYMYVMRHVRTYVRTYTCR